MKQARSFFHQLNAEYLAVHEAKEDLFWATYMGTSGDHTGFARAEQAYKDFISAPSRLVAVRAHLERLSAEPDGPEKTALVFGLEGWLRLFDCNVVDDDGARQHMRDLIEMETVLFAKNQEHRMWHQNEKGEREEASLGTLSTNMSTNRNEAARKSSHDALLELEQWVLSHGFLAIVSKRNEFARALGYRNYFDYKVSKNERMTPEELFVILDDFASRTHDANQRTLAALVAEKGETAILPYNLRYLASGDVTRQLDPYLPFAKGLDRWVQSFRRLGITYRGAVMQLDLLERKGKYQNGFCHGPIPPFYDDQGQWLAAHVNFTADAQPDQLGSGARALATLFHEGGHAAHFANVTQSSPCFSQEFAPTSMAYAETQSMFCDSLLRDADWLKRYARDSGGHPVPDALIRRRIETSQPLRAFEERSTLIVPYFEWALYQMSDTERTPEAVLALARATEQRILGVSPSPRPIVSIPHLLNQESAASYHGYLLANMAVYQTRAFFIREFGYLTDNPQSGPLLSHHYWSRGNSLTHDETLRSLTGEGFSARYLAEACTQSPAEAWTDAQAKIAAAATRDYPKEFPASLDATIRIVNGADVIADNAESESDMCQRFEGWVAEHYPASVASPPS